MVHREREADAAGLRDRPVREAAQQRPHAVGAQREAGRDGVAGEQLVPALAVEQHDHALLVRGAVHAPLRVDRQAADRLLVIEDERVEVVEHVAGARLDAVVVLHACGLCDLVRVRPLVARVAREARR